MSEYETALAYFRDRPDEIDVIQGDARAAQEHAATIVRGLMADDVVALSRAEWDEIKTIAERWPTVRSELQRLRALTPPADLPATLASVDDVRRVCEAAGLVASNVAQGRSWEHGLAYVESAGTGAVSSVVHHEVDGAERCTVEVYRGGPTVVLWHAIQAARSAS